MNSGWLIACVGFGYATVAVVCGMLLPLFWPLKQRGKVEAVLDVLYVTGLMLIVGGVFIHVVAPA